MLREMLDELNRLVAKYSSATWSHEPTANVLVELLMEHTFYLQAEVEDVRRGRRRLTNDGFLGPRTRENRRRQREEKRREARRRADGGGTDEAEADEGGDEGEGRGEGETGTTDRDAGGDGGTAAAEGGRATRRRRGMQRLNELGQREFVARRMRAAARRRARREAVDARKGGVEKKMRVSKSKK